MFTFRTHVATQCLSYIHQSYANLPSKSRERNLKSYWHSFLAFSIHFKTVIELVVSFYFDLGLAQYSKSKGVVLQLTM